MPELPDIELYLHALRPRIVGLRRLGKRVVWKMEDELFLVIHLMIAGRFRWKDAGVKVPGKLGLAAFDFPNGTLLLTEASSQRRAALYLLRGSPVQVDREASPGHYIPYGVR